VAGPQGKGREFLSSPGLFQAQEKFKEALRKSEGIVGAAEVVSPFWEAEDVARYLKIGVQCIYAKARKGHIPAHLIFGRYRFYPDEIQAWVKEQRVKPRTIARSQNQETGFISGARPKKRDISSLITKYTAKSERKPS
jgi:excisionase family DNA binding protein